MYNRTSILNTLRKRLGWDEPTLADYVSILNTDNKTKLSGRSFQSFHSLIKIPYIHSCQDDFEITNTEFNTWLSNIQDNCITDVLDSIYNEKDLIQQQLVYEYANVTTNTLENSTSFVGYEIKACKDKDISNVINQIITEFDKSEDITFYLFHSSQQNPIQSKTITVQELSITFTSLTDWEINYNIYKGGTWYIGYLRSGLTTKAINREWNNSAIKNVFNAVSIEPIIVNGWDTNTLFDIDNIEYSSDIYGLNFDISTLKDFTDNIKMNAKIFDVAIGLRMAVRCLQLYSTTRRENLDSSFAKLSKIAAIELENPEGLLPAGGVRQRYDAEIKRLKKLLFDEVLIEKITI